MSSDVTPRPWSTGGIFNPDGDNPTQNIWGPRGKNQSGILVALSAAIADAKFIVKAANCHEELLAALKACLAYIPGSEVHGWPPGFKLREEALRLGREALAKAEVQP